MQGPSPFTYTPTRRTQPYRAQGMARQPGPVLNAMQQGTTLFGQNPADIQRGMFTQPPPREGSLWWHILNLSAPRRTMQP